MDSVDPKGLRHSIADGAEMSARLADSVASTFERVAATYVRMAEETSSPDKAARLHGHIARLEDRARHERAEAQRLRRASDADG